MSQEWIVRRTGVLIPSVVLLLSLAGCAAGATPAPSSAPNASESPAGGTATAQSTASPGATPPRGLQGVTAVAAGGNHSCAVLRDGTVACWGYNTSGQLGDGTTKNRSQPATVFGLGGARAIATGFDHSCAVREDGTVACWGDNSAGALGDGTTTQRTVPVSVVDLAEAVAIAAGSGFTCALLRDATVSCWGGGHDGSLGDGSSGPGTYRTRPGPVPGLSGVVALAAGSRHACALDRDGTVACWGLNYHGQVGDGTTIDRSRPVVVASGVTSLGVGDGHTCVGKAQGVVQCWGRNRGGQLGTSPTGTNPHPGPVELSLGGVATLAAGDDHTCALLRDGSVACWGSNSDWVGDSTGQLGDGSLLSSIKPVKVAGLGGVVSLAAGRIHTCALLQNRTLSCWGGNYYGALGDGTTTHRPVPVPVGDPVVVPTPAPTVTPLAERQLRGSRQPVLDALAKLGYDCGSEQPRPNDLPIIACRFSGAQPNEGVVMYAAADDFRGIGLTTYDRNRLAQFLVDLGSQAISDDMMRTIDGVIRLAGSGSATLSGPTYGQLEGMVLAKADGLMVAVLQERGF